MVNHSSQTLQDFMVNFSFVKSLHRLTLILKASNLVKEKRSRIGGQLIILRLPPNNVVLLSSSNKPALWRTVGQKERGNCDHHCLIIAPCPQSSISLFQSKQISNDILIEDLDLKRDAAFLVIAKGIRDPGIDHFKKTKPKHHQLLTSPHSWSYLMR